MIKKEQVLSVVSELEIYKFYLGVNDLSKNISSPFSRDTNPSFKVFIDTLKYQCFSTSKHGDCFQLVADLFGFDSKRDFAMILDKIVTDMNLLVHFTTESKAKIKTISEHNTIGTRKQLTLKTDTKALSAPNTIDTNKSLALRTETKAISKSDAIAIKKPLRVKYREWTKEGLKFWNDISVDEATLKSNNVYQLDAYTFNSNTFSIKSDVLAFCYKVNERHKIYIPAQNGIKKQFYKDQNSEDVFGFSQSVLSDEPLFICAGEKDTLVLKANGYNAISFQSEITYPSVIELIDAKIDKVYICYDTDKTGRINSKKLHERIKNSTEIFLPDNYKDIADYFKTHTKQEFELIFKDPLQKIKRTFMHRMKEILDEKYDFRFNVVKSCVEYSHKHKNEFKQLKKAGQLFVDLCEVEERSRFNVTSISQLLESDFVKEYHPFQEYFKSLGEWDGKDYIREYCGYVEVDEPEDFYIQFTKWLVRTVKTATQDKYFNKQALIIVNPKQNTGKTTWCRNIVPPALYEYITEHFSVSKDGRIAMCRNLIINLDELEEWTRKDISLFKSALSTETINERLPYGKEASILFRTCSFIGSTNQKDFLNDETGTVRWLCFDVKKINFDYRNNSDINKVWSQAFHLSNLKSFDCEMTNEELEKSESRNKNFEKISMEAELIKKYYDKGDEIFETATDILCYIKNKENITLSSVMVGRALHKIGFVRDRYKGEFGYWLRKKL